MEGYLAQILMFGGNFAPRNWVFCDGQLLAISQNTALFSLLGTTYGGDGRTTFGIPEMRGRVPMHKGSGPGLTPRSLGQSGGVENVTLTANQMPNHSHPTAVEVNNQDGEEANVAGQFISNHPGAFNENGITGQTLGGVSSASAGGSQSHTNVQPFKCVNFVICVSGIFPSRN